MVKEALGYVLIGLWVSYVNANSGNPRLDLYRKANLLSQMMNIFAESVGALPKGASKIQYIIRIIREHRALERSVEEINYLPGVVKQPLPYFKYSIVEAKGIVPWGSFQVKINVGEHVLTRLGLKPHKKTKTVYGWGEVRKVILVDYSLKIKGGKAEYCGVEVGLDKVISVLGKIPAEQVSGFKVLDWSKVKVTYGTLEELKKGFKVKEINSEGAVLEKTTVLTTSIAMEILDRYANALMVEAVERGLVGKKLLEGFYMGGKSAYPNKAYFESSEA